MSPLYRGEIYCFISHPHLLVTSVLCLCVLSIYHTGGHETLTQCRFTSVRSVRSVRLSVPFISVSLSSAFYRAGGQTRDVGPILG